MIKKNKFKVAILIISVVLLSSLLLASVSLFPSDKISKRPTFGGTLVQSNIQYSIIGKKYGYTLSTNEYMEFYTGSDVGLLNDPFIAIYLRNGQNSVYDGLKLDSYDYITIDYDMWSNGSYFDSMIIELDARNTSGGFAKPNKGIIINSDSEPSISVEGEVVRTFNTAVEKNHFTWVVNINHNDYSNSYAFLYVNGKYVATLDSIFRSEADYISSLRFSANKTVESFNGQSICFGKVNVNVFGEGDGTYRGAIKDLFKNKKIQLEECVDSILYKGD